MELSEDEAELRAEAKKWINRAKSNADSAHALKGIPSIMREDPAFFFQQAVEKCLKAALVLEGIDFPRTHDLEGLTELIGKRTSLALPDWADRVESLNAYAAETRYPNESNPITAADLDAADIIASAAVLWASKLMES